MTGPDQRENVAGTEQRAIVAGAALPLIDLRAPDGACARAIHDACRLHGFFRVVGHDVPEPLLAELESLARAFFALPLEEKLRIRMANAGCTWRGYFPVGAELTSGVPDAKEGLYFGAELAASDPRVRAGLPLHGPNQFPAGAPRLRAVVLETMTALTALGHRLMALVARSLGLPKDHFAREITRDPTILFRIFHYPGRAPDAPGTNAAADAANEMRGVAHDFGVGEHTDYGLLTILGQDDAGGLFVRTTRDAWIAVPPLAGSFVCNIGDMLERMTGGYYVSTPHRVERGPRDRISFPFFFDPTWDARIAPLALARAHADDDAARSRRARWDGASVFDFDGTYGEYLVAKVARVFPHLM